MYRPPGGQHGPAQGTSPRGVVQLSQLIKLQGQQQGGNGPRTAAAAGTFYHYKTLK